MNRAFLPVAGKIFRIPLPLRFRRRIQDPVKASAYIGRVGGLAIALGVGVAMTSGIGAAWAEPHGSTTSDSSAGSTSSRTGGTTGAGPADPGPRVRIKRAEDQASRPLTGLTHELQ